MGGLALTHWNPTAQHPSSSKVCLHRTLSDEGRGGSGGHAFFVQVKLGGELQLQLWHMSEPNLMTSPRLKDWPFCSHLGVMGGRRGDTSSALALRTDTTRTRQED